MNNIDYISFKNIINEHNINLYDGDIRIAHCRFNNLFYNKLVNNEYLSIIDDQNTTINKLKKNPNLLIHLINSLVKNNINKINYIINFINQN